MKCTLRAGLRFTILDSIVRLWTSGIPRCGISCCDGGYNSHRLDRVFKGSIINQYFLYYYAGQQAFNGPIRLERNNSISRSLTSGRVQLYINQWGNICNDRFFGIAEADVVCHQLEYTGAISYSNALTEGLVTVMYQELQKEFKDREKNHNVHEMIVKNGLINGS